MRMIISMKMINSNNWAPRNKLNIPRPIRTYYYDNADLEIYIPELNIDRFYYELVSALYIILDKEFILDMFYKYYL
jgi:hypothetical protein